MSKKPIDAKSPFWTAFWAGMAAPTSLYASPATELYMAYVPPNDIPGSVAATGIQMANLFHTIENAGKRK